MIKNKTSPNIVLAKWRFKGEIDSFSFFCRNSLLYFLFFINLENNKRLLLSLVCRLPEIKTV